MHQDPAETEFQNKARKLSGHNLVAHHLNGIRLAIKDHSINTGKWLAAIAVAASTPQDNSAEVQKKLDEIAASLTLAATEQEDALKPFNKPKEN